MAIDIEGYKPSPVIGHTDDRGEPCLGTFRFHSKVLELREALASFAERKCTHCDRKETYDPSQVIIVAKPGITRQALEEFCAAIVEDQEITRKRQKIETAETKILSIAQDTANPSRFVAVIQINGIGLLSGDIEKSIRDLSIKAAGRFPEKAAYDDTVDTAWRKPVAYNWQDEVIPY